jgi:hypothetical protein
MLENIIPSYSQAEGREFEPRRPLQLKQTLRPKNSNVAILAICLHGNVAGNNLQIPLPWVIPAGRAGIGLSRFDEGRPEWELTMFQSPQAETFATEVYAAKRRRPDG